MGLTLTCGQVITIIVPGYVFKGIVKTALLNMDGNYAIMVLRHSEKIDIERMKDLLNAQSIKVVQEEECQKLFPNCDVTALPALGRLFNMPVYCSPTALAEESICFNVGTHEKVVEVRVDDYLELEHPHVGNFTTYGYKETKYEFAY